MQLTLRMLMFVPVVVAVVLSVALREPVSGLAIISVIVGSWFGGILAEHKQRIRAFFVGTVCGVTGTAFGSAFPAIMRSALGNTTPFIIQWLETTREYWWVGPVFGLIASFVGSICIARQRFRLWTRRFAFAACSVAVLVVLAQSWRYRTEIWFSTKYANSVGNNNLGRLLRQSLGLVDIEFLGLRSDFAAQDFQALQKLSSLGCVTLTEREISDDEFAALAKVPNLTALHLYQCKFSGSGLQQLSKSKSLQYLHFHDATLDSGDIKSIATLPIQSLFFHSVCFENCSLNTLKSMPCFLTLRLFDTELPQDFDLTAFQSLQSVSLVRANLNDNLVRKLVEQAVSTKNRLQYLDLKGNRLTDGSVDALKRLTSVATLSVSDTELSQEALSNLRTSMPNVTIYSDGE